MALKVDYSLFGALPPSGDPISTPYDELEKDFSRYIANTSRKKIEIKGLDEFWDDLVLLDITWLVFLTPRFLEIIFSRDCSPDLFSGILSLYVPCYDDEDQATSIEVEARLHQAFCVNQKNAIAEVLVRLDKVNELAPNMSDDLSKAITRIWQTKKEKKKEKEKKRSGMLRRKAR
ncbi:MAG: hypothetical protein AAFY08_15055 [Planctomycetota bacterium]